jgi:hypothetical protein
MDFLAHKTPSYDTNRHPKVGFDKTAFVKFKISNTFKPNIDEADSKQPKIYTSLWILKIREPKVSRHLPTLRDFQ